jgi:hypothetical protein
MDRVGENSTGKGEKMRHQKYGTNDWTLIEHDMHKKEETKDQIREIFD